MNEKSSDDKDNPGSGEIEKALHYLDEKIAKLDRDLHEQGKHLEQYNEPNPLSIPGVPNLTDLGNAQRMHDQWGDSLHYSTNARKWYVWDKRLWNPDAEAALNKWAAKTVKGIYTEAARVKDRADKERIAKHAIRSESKLKIAAMLELLRYLEDIPIAEDAFDTDHWCLTSEEVGQKQALS